MKEAVARITGVRPDRYVVVSPRPSAGAWTP